MLDSLIFAKQNATRRTGATIMLMQGISVKRMTKLYGVHGNTLRKFIRQRGLILWKISGGR